MVQELACRSHPSSNPVTRPSVASHMLIWTTIVLLIVKAIGALAKLLGGTGDNAWVRDRILTRELRRRPHRASNHP